MSARRPMERSTRFKPIDGIRGMDPNTRKAIGGSHGEAVRRLLERLSWLELTPAVLARALEPWPVALRMLDALHLASMEFLRSRGERITLASYDDRKSPPQTVLRFPCSTSDLRGRRHSGI